MRMTTATVASSALRKLFKQHCGRPSAFSRKQGLTMMKRSVYTRSENKKARKPVCIKGLRAFEKVVPEAGVEPARYRYHRILSPARLPIPSFRQLYRSHLQRCYYIIIERKKQELFYIFLFFGRKNDFCSPNAFYVQKCARIS